MSFYVIIPARLQSSRLPRKVLLDIHGKSMLQHVFEQAKKSLAKDVFIATDDKEVHQVANAFGAKAFMTAPNHASGTDRIAEVVKQGNFKDDDILINVQGDEPLIPPEFINLVAETLSTYPKADVATLAESIQDKKHYLDPNVVKVVVDKTYNALYFSRASIPWYRNGIPKTLNYCFKHIGIYAYRASFIKDYFELMVSPLEQIELLEQLRVLWHGYKIQVAVTELSGGIGVDTEEDLERVRSILTQ